MAITPAELPGYLAQIRQRVVDSAVPVADAIGDAYKTHLKDVTLTESGSHPPVTRTPAAPGGPPAQMEGHLRDTVAKVPAVSVGEGIAETSVAPHTIYAATIQHGGVHEGDMWLWVRYVGAHEVLRRGWRKQRVEIPAYPYMDVAVREAVAAGKLQRAGAERFTEAVWG